MEKILIENKIKSLINSGVVKRVSIDMINNINNFELSKDNIVLFRDVLNEYKQYLKSIDIINYFRDLYLDTLLKSELIDNQELEGLDPFVVSMFQCDKYENSIDFIVNRGGPINKNDFLKAHQTLLFGTNSLYNDNFSVRDSNVQFVGRKENDENVISYIPIDCKDIDDAISGILNLYNDNSIDNDFDIFIKPFLLHGVIAGLQCFRDGNTRLARNFQHIKLWKMTKKIDTFKDLELPALYLSKQYLKDRDKYRSFIKSIAVDTNNSTINDWLKYNLYCLEDGIFDNQKKIENIAYTLNIKKPR